MISESIKNASKGAPMTTTLGLDPDGGLLRPLPGHVPAIEDFRSVMVQRAIFQGVASMGLPAFTIHSIVRYSGKALKNAKNQIIRTYGPIGVRKSVSTSNTRDTLADIWTLARSCRCAILTIHLRQTCGGGGRVDVPQGIRNSRWTKRCWPPTNDR